MVLTSLCYGFWIECPQQCLTIEPEKNQEKCFVWRICKKDWIDSGGRIGLFDLIKMTEN